MRKKITALLLSTGLIFNCMCAGVYAEESEENFAAGYADEYLPESGMMDSDTEFESEETNLDAYVDVTGDESNLDLPAEDYEEPGEEDGADEFEEDWDEEAVEEAEELAEASLPEDENDLSDGEGSPDFDGELALVGGPLYDYGSQGNKSTASLQEIDPSKIKTNCNIYKGRNVEYQDYQVWSAPVTSYLTKSPDGGLMRVQSGAVDGKLIIEYYDSGYNYKSTVSLDLRYPVFGGFYEGPDAYYILTGQSNTAESNDVVVFDIAKYTKDWHLAGSASLKGANTREPFEAGSARFAMSGKYLFVRTCHKMFKSSDGVNHQANVTIQVDTDTMTITDSYTGVMNSSYGYVSHSFNQFIIAENDRLVGLDHGDAYPRSIVLLKYPRKISSGKFVPDWNSGFCDVVDIVSFQGYVGENYTGASVGGFQASSSHYLAAGSIETDYYNSGCANVFVGSVPKSGGEPVVRCFTNYAQSNENASTPHLISIGNDTFLLIWSSEAVVYYLPIDGTGQACGEMQSFKGNLSDCVPCLYDGKVVWHTWNDGSIVFYEIDADDLSKHNAVIIKNGHKFGSDAKVSNGVLSGTCTVCGKSAKAAVPTSLAVYWANNGSEDADYSTLESAQLKSGDKLWYQCYENYDSDLSDRLSDIAVTSSAPDIIAVTEGQERYGESWKSGTISVGQGKGKVTIAFTPSYNKSAASSFTFYVDCISKECVRLEKTSFMYTGKAIEPKVEVKFAGTKLVQGRDYDVKYTNNVKVGTGKVTVTGIGSYTGSATVKFSIYKDTRSKQPMTVKVDTVTLKKKNKKQTIKKSKVFSITNAQGAVSFEKKSGSKKLSINKKGKITVAKGTKKGTYSMKVVVTAAGNSYYQSGSKTVKVKVKIQ